MLLILPIHQDLSILPRRHTFQDEAASQDKFAQPCQVRGKHSDEKRHVTFWKKSKANCQVFNACNELALTRCSLVPDSVLTVLIRYANYAEHRPAALRIFQDKARSKPKL